MKKILLTGASKGIGKAILHELSPHYEVIAPSSYDLDLSRSESIDYFLKHHTSFDGLINNAGINFIRPLEDIANDELEKIIMVNLLSPLKITQKLVPYMRSHGGKIVNISSIWGIRSKEFRTLYSMTKFGLIGQTKALARELGQYNILINAVCPGFTLTDLTDTSLSQAEKEALVKEIPLGRMAQPSEIAKSVKFFIGEDNSYITGQTLVIDGGFLA